MREAEERRKRALAEAALAESEERFRRLVEGVKDYAIYMLDTQGRIISWNAGAEWIKGYRAEEIVAVTADGYELLSHVGPGAWN